MKYVTILILLCLIFTSCDEVTTEPQLHSVLWDKPNDITQIETKKFMLGRTAEFISTDVYAQIKYKNLKDPRQTEPCLVAFLTISDFTVSGFEEENAYVAFKFSDDALIERDLVDNYGIKKLCTVKLQPESFNRIVNEKLVSISIMNDEMTVSINPANDSILVQGFELLQDALDYVQESNIPSNYVEY